MEGSGILSLSAGSSPESSTGGKADCYFYYYSSCNKGNSCPFRHEPAALRNETMCVYWLKGSCNKPHCIYRHMEITKNRNKIPCFFEGQPGGCKKLHCPFFHNNVLDQPREEDVPNNPDLILPVKDSELEYETKESEIKKLQDSVAAQLKIQRSLCKSQLSFNKDKDAHPDSPTPSIIRKSFIVPLQDGESDSESVTVTPVKQSGEERRYVVADEEIGWELERLKEIQKEESHLLGYSFESEDEEIVDDEHVLDSFDELEEEFIDDMEEFDDMEEEATFHQTILRKSFDPKNFKDNLSGFAKRVIGETLLTNANHKPMRKISRSHNSENLVARATTNNTNKQRVIKKLEIVKVSPRKTSVKERLGKKMSEAHKNQEKREDSLISRLSLKDSVKKRIKLNEENEGKIKSRIQITENKQKSPNDGSEIVIKSLADIKAEKERLKWSNGQPPKGNNYSELLPLSAYISNKRSTDNLVKIDGIKIKTLAEIKAEKTKVSSETRQNAPSTKRSHSPITFDASASKKLKIIKKKEIENQKPSLAFKSRKLALKRVNPNSVAVNQSSSDLSMDNSTTKPDVSSRLQFPEVTPLEHYEKIKSRVPQDEKKNITRKISSVDLPDRRRSSGENGTNNTVKASPPESKSHQQESSQLHLNRVDSFIDEEELLLLDESPSNMIDDMEEEIDEDELLL